MNKVTGETSAKPKQTNPTPALQGHKRHVGPLRQVLPWQQADVQDQNCLQVSIFSLKEEFLSKVKIKQVQGVMWPFQGPEPLLGREVPGASGGPQPAPRYQGGQINYLFLNDKFLIYRINAINSPSSEQSKLEGKVDGY